MRRSRGAIGPVAALCPAASYLVLLADPRLVGELDFYLVARIDSLYDLNNVEDFGGFAQRVERSVVPRQLFPSKRPFTERLERVSLQSNLRGRRHERKHIAPQGKARITHDA